jgi:glycosyltransferase involved in cell wall biosynthesis
MAERLGVDLLIRAVARLRDRVPGARLHLWGHGDDLPDFQRLATELGIGESIAFNEKGFPLKDLPHQLGAMDVGVVGNRRSAACDLMLPVKLLEYVSLGIPAVVPRLRTIEHYFSDQMVSFYEPENVESLADAILGMHADPDRRRAQAARAGTFLADHGWQRQGAELVTMYQQLLEN